MRQALWRRHALMEVRPRKDELIVLQVLVENHLAGLGVRAPHVLRRVALLPEERADFRADVVLDPVHSFTRLRPSQCPSPACARRLLFLPWPYPAW